MNQAPQETDRYPVHGSAWGLPLLVLAGLQLMVVLDGTVVNLALPRIQTELGLSDSLRSWVITGYALAYGGLLLLGGRLGDAFGRRRMFLLGTGIFTAASLVAGLATGPWLLLLSRAVQGLGAALASPTAMALIVVTFAPGKTRNQAFSVFAMMTGLGSVMGLVLGGALTEASWRWIFLINVPIGLAIVLGGMASLKVFPTEQRIPLDIMGAVLATGASTLLVYGLTAGGGGWLRPETLIPTAVGVALLVAFFLSQRGRAGAVMPLSMFSRPARAATFFGILMVGALMMPMTVQVAFYVQDVLGYGPLQAGLAFIPFAFAMGIGSGVAGQLALKRTPRVLIAGGGVLLIASFVVSSRLNPQAQYFPTIFLLVLAIGIAIGLVLIPLTLSVVAGVDPSDVGPLTATSLVAQTLGGPLGLAAASGIAEAITRNRLGDAYAQLDRTNMSTVEINALSAGYTGSLLLCAALTAVLIVVALVFIDFTAAEIAEGQEAEAVSQQG